MKQTRKHNIGNEEKTRTNKKTIPRRKQKQNTTHKDKGQQNNTKQY